MPFIKHFLHSKYAVIKKDSLLLHKEKENTIMERKQSKYYPYQNIGNNEKDSVYYRLVEG